MEDVKTLETLLNKVIRYNSNPNDLEIIKKAYECAEKSHLGQFRQSGEPYISHPLYVAHILAEMHADTDTICAGLLHDTIEDTEICKEDIASMFNPSVANLVDGVTKIRKLQFSSKDDLKLANTRKIITGITEDVRIIIIKLADRLHNMRTLQFKNESKQKEISLETMELFAPLAYYIGAYRIKSELEDLSLKYLKPDVYKKIEEKKLRIEDDSRHCMEQMLTKIDRILSDENIQHDIKVRTKNIYGIYKKISEGYKIIDIHDLLALKIVVDEWCSCYSTLGLIHATYHPLNGKFKDYICNPKTNMYRSLHTTVFGPEERLVQAQIRTFEMDKVATYGLATYWDIIQGNARDMMQKDLKRNYQFFSSLIEIDRMFGDNQEFIHQVKSEVLSDKIYVYTTSGEIIELPVGSTPIDFAYRIHTEMGNSLEAAIVNDEYVPLNYQLRDKDRVKIITNDLSFGPREEWLSIVKTTKAKRKIKELLRTKNI